MFQLVYGDHDLSIQLHFDTHVEDHLTQLVALDVEANAEGGAASRSQLAALIVSAITAVVDPCAAASTKPTPAQLGYALGICRDLKLPIPNEVLRDRVAMTAFLDKHAADYRTRYRKRRDQATRPKHS